MRNIEATETQKDREPSLFIFKIILHFAEHFLGVPETMTQTLGHLSFVKWPQTSEGDLTNLIWQIWYSISDPGPWPQIMTCPLPIISVAKGQRYSTSQGSKNNSRNLIVVFTDSITQRRRWCHYHRQAYHLPLSQLKQKLCPSPPLTAPPATNNDWSLTYYVSSQG